MAATVGSSRSEAGVIFDFSPNSADYKFSMGTGFGVDSAEPGTLVDLKFAVNASLSGTHFTLNAPGDSHTFELGSVQFNELDINIGEFDNLNVAAELTYALPTAGTAHIAGSVVPVFRPVNDDDLDLSLFFNPVNVNFGAGEQFTISLGSYSFLGNGVQPIFATVTLNTAAAPEPGSLVLMSVAGGLVVAGRRFRKQRCSALAASRG